MNRRGISSIVTTVIIILISVAAVSGIWLVIKPLVEESSIKASPVICQTTNFEVKSCQKIITSAGQSGYNIGYSLIDKNDQAESFSDIKIIIELEDGSRLAGSGDNSIQVGESKDVQLITDQVVSGSSILSIINLDAKRKTSCVSEVFTCDNEEAIPTESQEDQQIPVSFEELEESNEETCGISGPLGWCNGLIMNSSSGDLGTFVDDCSQYSTSGAFMGEEALPGLFASGSVQCTSCQLDFSECQTDEVIEGYPGCFGQARCNPANDCTAPCERLFDEETCNSHNNWDNRCTWKPDGYCNTAPYSSNPDCALMDEETCNANNGMENGCSWVYGPSCAGPFISSCSSLSSSDVCNAIGGCKWESAPSCGNGELNYDEECDASAKKFFWYDDSIGGHYTYIGTLNESNCGADIRHL